MSVYTPGGRVTTVRTTPISLAWRSSRDTRAWDMLSSAAICGCLMPPSWYMRATLAMSLSWATSTGRFIEAPPAGRLTTASRVAAWLIAGACICRFLGARLAVEQRTAGDLVGGQGILPVLSLAQGGDVEHLQCAADAPHRVDALAGRFDGVLPERDLVQLPDTLPAALAERVEELERLGEVHRADHEVVVPAPEVVVDVDSVEQAA